MSVPTFLNFNKCYARRPSTTYHTIADTRWHQCTEDKDSTLGDGKLCRSCYLTRVDHREAVALGQTTAAELQRLGPRRKGWHGMMGSGTCPTYSILWKRGTCEPHVVSGHE